MRERKAFMMSLKLRPSGAVASHSLPRTAPGNY
jgi:hypothetical protein